MSVHEEAVETITRIRWIGLGIVALAVFLNYTGTISDESDLGLLLLMAIPFLVVFGLKKGQEQIKDRYGPVKSIDWRFAVGILGIVQGIMLYILEMGNVGFLVGFLGLVLLLQGLQN